MAPVYWTGETVDHLLTAIDLELVRRQKSDPGVRFSSRFSFNFKSEHFAAGAWARWRRAGSTCKKVLQMRARLTKSQRAHLDRLVAGKQSGGGGRGYQPGVEEALAELSRRKKELQTDGLRLTASSRWMAPWGRGEPWAGGRWASSRSVHKSDTTRRAKLTDRQQRKLDRLYEGSDERGHLPAASPRLPPQLLLTSAPPLPLSPPDLSSRSALPGPCPRPSV